MIVLSTGVLVAVIAFAAAIKPISDGRLTVLTAAKFIALAIPPMLAYALPFASGFASTMVHHRMAQDNEITAAQAGGVSHRVLLVPAAVTALVLAGLLALLNESVIPRFLREMERTVKRDMSQWLASEIPKGRAVDFNNITVYADAAKSYGRDPASGATNRLALARTMAIVTDRKTGDVTREIAAERADLWFYPAGTIVSKIDASRRELSEITIRVRNGTIIENGNINSVQVQDDAELAWMVPDMLRDNPKFFSYSQLRELRDRPEGINWIEEERKTLALCLAEKAVVRDIRGAIERDRAVTFMDAHGRPVLLRSGGLGPTSTSGKWEIKPAKVGGDIEVEFEREPENGRPARLFIASEAGRLETSVSWQGASKRLVIKLVLEKARSRAADQQDQLGAERAVLPISNLSLAGGPEQKFLNLSSWELLDEARYEAAAGRADEQVTRAAGVLEQSVTRMMRLVTSKQHERWAMAASCFVMVITGGVTALRLSRRLPLTVYLWTFFPALACIATISGGQQTVAEVGLAGLPLLWGGVVGLTLYTLVVYRVLARH